MKIRAADREIYNDREREERVTWGTQPCFKRYPTETPLIYSYPGYSGTSERPRGSLGHTGLSNFNICINYSVMFYNMRYLLI